MVKNAHVIVIGANAKVRDAVLVPKDSYHIDKKLDDGLPKSGIVTFYIHSSHSNVTDATCTGATKAYKLSSDVVGCNLVFTLQSS